MVKQQKVSFFLFYLLVSQTSLRCSDDVPWYRTFKVGLAVGTVVTVVIMKKVHQIICFPKYQAFQNHLDALTQKHSKAEEKVQRLSDENNRLQSENEQLKKENVPRSKIV